MARILQDVYIVLMDVDEVDVIQEGIVTFEGPGTDTFIEWNGRIFENETMHEDRVIYVERHAQPIAFAHELPDRE